MAGSVMSEQQLELVAQRFRVLSDPMRLRVLHHLQTGEMSVGALVEATGASQPNISKHLSILRGAGLVTRRQEGNLAYFAVGAAFVFELCDIVCNGIREEFEDLKASFS